MLTKKLVTAAAVAAFGLGTAGSAGVAQARHGSDDPPSHHARDDRGARHHHHHHHHRRGAEDRPGDDHGSDR